MSAECLTKAEAQHRFPRARLYWHTTARCWDDQPVGRYPYQRDAAEPAASPGPEIAFPALVRGGAPAADWLSPWPSATWMAVWDFDETTFRRGQ